MTGSAISTSVSGGSGGVVFFSGTSNTMTTDATSSITASTAANHGGVAYFNGGSGS